MNGPSETYYAESAQHVLVYKLEPGETISVESENLLAFTQDCKYSVRFIGVGVLSQKGLATATLTGNGNDAYVAVITDGNPIALSNVQSGSVHVLIVFCVSHCGLQQLLQIFTSGLWGMLQDSHSLVGRLISD